jgi:hypothetical protein
MLRTHMRHWRVRRAVRTTCAGSPGVWGEACAARPSDRAQRRREVEIVEERVKRECAGLVV